ncbi:F-box-like protein [Legionella nautarum]|uniref:F-box-like protein n=1 Tax=Legionella nautarum TaxID=45070 RepID=A0A0W0WSA3_9GAMM|nr:F-box-like domain-containing protein [Legionella nautarum]KTD35181.1 F-box-like protein [Legionella nautarum]
MRDLIENTDNERNQLTANPELPDELWLHIFSFLDLESLLNTELVSSKFRDLISDISLWEKLFLSFFPQERPDPLPDDFNWKKEFTTLYFEQFGLLNPETRKLIALIVTGDLATIRTLNISIEDLKADSLVLIKTATRLNRQAILEHFYSLSEHEFEATTNHELELLRWAVLRNRGQANYSKAKNISFAAEAGLLDLLLELLNSSENPTTQNLIGFRQLKASVICSGQMYMLRGFENFLEQLRSQASTEPDSLSIADIIEYLRSSEPEDKIAASLGIFPIFRRFSEQRQATWTQIEKQLNAANASSPLRNKWIARHLKTERDVVAQTMGEALIPAAENGHIHIIKYALQKQFISVEQRLRHNATLLSKAALFYQFDTVQYLLANQADPEVALAQLLTSNLIDSMVEPESKGKAQHEEMLDTLWQALEQRGILHGTELLTAVINNDRLDLLERLFNLDQGRLIKMHTIQTLLQQSGKNCEQFLKDQLKQAQSQPSQSTSGSSSSYSAEEKPVTPAEHSGNNGSQSIDLPELPDEIWFHILSFNDPESLFQTELVSSKFRALVNDKLIWERLYRSFFPKDLPSPLPNNFNWKKEFITLYTEQFGLLKPETRKLIALIVAGDLDTIQTLNISIEDLKADNLVLIKTAIRLNQQPVLVYFYSISQQGQPVKTDLAKGETDHGQRLLHWALFNRESTDIFESTLLAAEAGLLDLCLELLNSPKNPATENFSKFQQLLTSVIRSRQRYMMKGLEHFIVNYQKLNPGSSNFKKAIEPACELPNMLNLIASDDAFPILSRLCSQLHQELVQQEQALKAAIDSSANEEVEPLRGKVDLAKRKWGLAMETALFSAAEKGYASFIKDALKKGLINNIKPGFGNILLTRAALFHHSALVQLLLANQADPEAALTSLLDFSPADEQKNQREKMITILLEALEKRGTLNSADLLKVVVRHNRLDLLERLFSFAQETFINTDIIQTLLQQATEPCATFLKDKLESTQSKPAPAQRAPGTSSSDSAEPVAPTSNTNADNAHRFFGSSTAASTENQRAETQKKGLGLGTNLSNP